MTSIHRLVALATTLSLAACIGDRETKAIAETFETASRRPDQVPEMLNPRPPFEYPRELLANKVQGNVILRLHVDSAGRVVPDSTEIVESSGEPRLDSAALAGVPELRFKPAMKAQQPIGASFLFPVFFRAPGAPPLAGDTILQAYERQRRASTKQP